MKKDKYAIGIDIGQNFIRTSVVDSAFKPVNSLAVSIHGVRGVSEKCINLVEELMNKSELAPDDIEAIGLGAGRKFASTSEKIRRKFNVGTYYGDSAACAACGEKFLNDDISGLENILYIYSDLGSAVILKGKKIMTFPPEKSKYLEPWHASFGIREIAIREVARGVGTKIVTIAGGRMDSVDDAAVSEAARQGDEVASNIIHSVGVTLGLRIAYLVNLFNPQAIVLGGGMEKEQTMLSGPITGIIKKLALRSNSQELKIMAGKLGEDAAIIGAASLAASKISCK